LKQYDLKFEKIVNLGQGMYAFVRPLNKFVILPIFNFMKILRAAMHSHSFTNLFIRLLTSPLVYKSYLSGAKMKALRPEIAKLKAKHGDDRQAMSMDQNETVQEAGVIHWAGVSLRFCRYRYSLPCSVSLIPRLVYVEHISFGQMIFRHMILS